MSDQVDITGATIAAGDLGDLWLDFEQTLIPETSIIFNTAYNLISLMLEENVLGMDVHHILINDALSTPNKINEVRSLLISYMVDILTNMGVEFNKDFIDLNSLYDLVNIINTIFSLVDTFDLLGIINILESDTEAPKDKFISIVIKVNELDEDGGNLPYIINDISPGLIRGLMLSLNIISEDDTDYIEPFIIKRIRNNKELFKDTVGYEHLIKGGVMGSSFNALSNIYINELANLMAVDKKEYFRNVFSLLIVSGYTNNQIRESFTKAANEFSETQTELYEANSLLEKVLLDE